MLIATFDYADLDTETRIVVQQKTSEIRSLMKRSGQDIVDIGQRLDEVKQRLPHGEFECWLKHEFEWTERHARRFMSVHRAFGEQSGQIDRFAPSALYLFAAPSVPEEARQEAIAIAQTGEIVTHALAKQVIEAHKPPAEQWIDKNHNQPAPAPVQSAVETAQKRGNYTAGSTALVTEGKHKGETVTIAKVEGGAIAHSHLPNGQSFPFLVGELEVIEAAPVPEKPAKPGLKEENIALRNLLREVFCDFGATLPAELRLKIEAVLA